MSNVKLGKMQKGRMTIQPRVESDTVHVEIEGICDSFAVKGLGAFLTSVAEEVTRSSLRHVNIDISQVSLLNSSCIKQFITFIRPIKAGQLDCKVCFTVAPSIPWQRRSMSALVRMCPSAVSLVGGSETGSHPSRAVSFAKPLSTAPGAS